MKVKRVHRFLILALLSIILVGAAIFFQGIVDLQQRRERYKDVRIGMSVDQVKTLLGDPDDTWSSVRTGAQTWVYADKWPFFHVTIEDGKVVSTSY